VYYLGLRSTAGYLRDLGSVREMHLPHHLLSVIGGFAFLHALSPECRSLTLVDADPDALDHWALLRALLLEAASLGDFVSLLSGYEATDVYDDPARFLTRPIDVSGRLDRCLPPAQRELHRRTYGALAIDASRAEGRVGNERVRFLGYHPAPNTYCWQFGTGCFRDEESFGRLQATLRRVPSQVSCSRLEDQNYGGGPWGATERVVLLVSNCDSPLFTRGDRILRRVLKTARTEVRYLSWVRDLRTTVPEEAIEATAEHAALPACVLRLPGGAPAQPRLRPGAEREFRTAAEVLALTEYGTPLLIIEGGEQEEVVSLAEAIAPTFERIVWRPRHLPLSPLVSEDLRLSYLVSSPRIAPAVHFVLRGLRPSGPR
jgi:hypothetical protein